MSIQKIYDKFKHLDPLLSDKEWLSFDNLLTQVLYELWQAIKKDINKEEAVNGNKD